MSGKYRLTVTDGGEELGRVALDTTVSGVPVPGQHAVIRVSAADTPAGVPRPALSSQGNKFVLWLHHYQLLKHGDEVMNPSAAAASAGVEMLDQVVGGGDLGKKYQPLDTATVIGAKLLDIHKTHPWRE